LPDNSQEQLIEAMRLVERLIDDQPRRGIISLREPRGGEFGWLMHRQAVLFASEHGWDQSFEGWLAQIIASFTLHGDPLRDICWVVEQSDTVIGSAMVTGAAPSIARIEMLYIEPDMRRLGIGTQMMEECVRFARRAGYRQLTLSTVATLTESRRLCERAGFSIASSAPESRFGRELTVERWERDL
jgi:GNAT superfamily N-acetyltransferase